MKDTADGQVRLDPAAHANLTDWKKEPTLADLKSDFDEALPQHRMTMAKIQEWNDLMRIEGSAKPKTAQGRSKVQPKLIRRQAEWRYPALSEPFMSSNKLYQAKARSGDDVAAARQNSLVINWQWQTQLNRVRFIDNMVRSTVDEGTCVIRPSWVRQTKKVQKEVPFYAFYEIIDEAELAEFQKLMELYQTDPKAFEAEAEPEQLEAVLYAMENGIPVTASVERTEMVETEEVVENRPEATVFNPNNVVIDPSCEGDTDKAMFAVFMIETNRAEINKNKDSYKNYDKIDWDNAGPMTDPNRERQSPDNFKFKDATRKRVIMYEYWGYYDINGDGTLEPIVAAWIGNTLVRLEMNPFADKKLPLVLIPYLPVKREMYGETDAELMSENQAILGAVTRGMIDLLARSANSQQGFAKGMLDPMNRRKFEQGEDYEFNPTMNPQNGNHITHTYPEIPQSALLMVQMQNQDAEALSGVKAFSGGLSGNAYGDVAAGVRGMLDAASKREMSILRRLVMGMIQLGRKMVMMNQQFLSEEEVIRVTDEEFVSVKREELQGEFDIELDISTAEIEDAQAQDLAFMLQTMGPTMDFGITKMVLAEIADLKRMPNLANKIRAFEPAPDPLAQKKAELEIAELEARIEEIRSKAGLNAAKAEEAGANTDKANLDYVEQETGTKHAREVDKSRAQARGNQDLQITKALTSPKKEGETDPDVEAAIGYNTLSDMRDEAGTGMSG